MCVYTHLRTYLPTPWHMTTLSVLYSQCTDRSTELKICTYYCTACITDFGNGKQLSCLTPCMYVRMYIHTYICTYIHNVHTYVCMYVPTYLHVHTYLHTYLPTYVRIRMYTCTQHKGHHHSGEYQVSVSPEMIFLHYIPCLVPWQQGSGVLCGPHKKTTISTHQVNRRVWGWKWSRYRKLHM